MNKISQGPWASEFFFDFYESLVWHKAKMEK